MKKNLNTARLTRAALVAALYVVLTMISSMVGLSSGVIQCRLSEALTVLPALMPEAIPGLVIGCVISNLLANGVIWDVIFGSVATLIGAFGAYFIGRLGRRFYLLIPIPTVLSNALIVPLVLIYAYSVPDAYWFLFATVGIGEVISAGVFGTVLYKAIVSLPSDKLKFITKEK